MASTLSSGKNWPALYPLIYHDIEAELPFGVHSLAKRSYFIWQRTIQLPIAVIVRP